MRVLSGLDCGQPTRNGSRCRGCVPSTARGARNQHPAGLRLRLAAAPNSVPRRQPLVRPVWAGSNRRRSHRIPAPGRDRRLGEPAPALPHVSQPQDRAAGRRVRPSAGAREVSGVTGARPSGTPKRHATAAVRARHAPTTRLVANVEPLRGMAVILTGGSADHKRRGRQKNMRPKFGPVFCVRQRVGMPR